VLGVELLPWLPTTEIVLDLASELPSRLGLDVRPPSAEEGIEALDKLDRALALLRAASSQAADLVFRLVDVACVRTGADDAPFGTCSDATTLGVIHIANAHRATSHVDIATALVREAVNQALYCWELHHPLILSESDAKVRSPWTGRPLGLYAFVHACFAWYGVASMWQTCSAPYVEAWLHDATAGFARQPLAYLGDFARHLPHDIIAAIDEMTRLIAPLPVQHRSSATR
jgi:HEXXH motif-containing protein